MDRATKERFVSELRVRVDGLRDFKIERRVGVEAIRPRVPGAVDEPAFVADADFFAEKLEQLDEGGGFFF